MYILLIFTILTILFLHIYYLRDAKETGGVCDTCVVGQYTGSLGQEVCKTCPEGTTSASEATEAAADCSTCLAGRFRESTSSGNCTWIGTS